MFSGHLYYLVCCCAACFHTQFEPDFYENICFACVSLLSSFFAGIQMNAIDFYNPRQKGGRSALKIKQLKCNCLRFIYLHNLYITFDVVALNLL